MTIKDIFALDGKEVTNKELGRIIGSKHFEEVRNEGDNSYDIVINHGRKLALITVKIIK